MQNLLFHLCAVVSRHLIFGLVGSYFHFARRWNSSNRDTWVRHLRSFPHSSFVLLLLCLSICREDTCLVALVGRSSEAVVDIGERASFARAFSILYLNSLPFAFCHNLPLSWGVCGVYSSGGQWIKVTTSVTGIGSTMCSTIYPIQ